MSARKSVPSLRSWPVMLALAVGPAAAAQQGETFESQSLAIVTVTDNGRAVETDPVRARQWPRADERTGRDPARSETAGPAPDEGAIRSTLDLLGPRFRRTETTNFVVLSDCPADWTRTRAALLERARHQFYRAAGRLYVKPAPHPRKLLCVLINDHDRFREFGRLHDGLDAGWVAGYYSAQNNRIVFYNDALSPEYEQVWSQLAGYDAQVRDARERARTARAAGRQDIGARLEIAADDLEGRVRSERQRLTRQADDFATAKAIHEAVHLLAFNTGLQRRGTDYPFWLSEGLAASFETSDPETAFGPDRDGSAQRRARYRELQGTGDLPRLSEIVSLSRSTLLEADAADAMYAASATLFEHLYRHKLAELSLYIRALNETAGRRLTPEQHRTLFVRHFGDADSLERKIAGALR